MTLTTIPLAMATEGVISEGTLSSTTYELPLSGTVQVINL